MTRCQAVHDLRQYYIEVGSPQTNTQRLQVMRVINYLTEQREAEAQGSRLTKRTSFLINADSARSSGPVNTSIYANYPAPSSFSYGQTVSKTKSGEETPKKMKSLNSISDYIQSSSGCSLPKVQKAQASSGTFSPGSSASPTPFSSPISANVIEKSSGTINPISISNPPKAFPLLNVNGSAQMDVESEDEGIICMNVDSVLDDLTRQERGEETDLDQSLLAKIETSTIASHEEQDFSLSLGLEKDDKDDGELRDAEVVINKAASVLVPSPPVSTPPPSHKSYLSSRKVE